MFSQILSNASENMESCPGLVDIAPETHLGLLKVPDGVGGLGMEGWACSGRK